MFDFDPNKDYYNVLWVTESSTDDEIKKAFRKLAMQHHPDKWWDQEKFKQINEAYQVVWDKQKRQQYDSVRKWWFGGFWWQWWFWWWATSFDVEDIFDVFGNLFWWQVSWWRWWRHHWPRKWTDIIINLHVTIEEVYKWWNREIKFDRKVHCDDCKWSGVAWWWQKTSCSTCWWRWVVLQQQRTPFGVMQTQTTCPTCHWEWHINTNPCKKCNWNWLSTKQEKIDLEIPAWIEEWEYIKFTWMGNYWPNWWDSWDLYIKFVYKPSEKFKRKWNQLLIEVSISIYDAVIGGEIEVDHPEWKIKVKIPKWLQIWDHLSVSWKGFGRWWFLAKRWDFIVVPKISIPKKLSKEEEKLWKQLKDLNS